MKKFTYLALLLTTIIGFSSQARAALLLEPVVGYSVGTFNYNAKELSSGLKDSGDDSINGPSYGGRVGYQNLGFQIGVDYLASSLGSDFSASEIGGFIGFEFPVLFRVYAGYVASASATFTDDDLDKDIKLKGTGPKFGIGFTLLPFLDVNLEYRSISYDPVTLKGPDGNGGTTKIEFTNDYSATMLSFSIPFTI